MIFAPSKSRKRAKIWNMGELKISDHIQMKIKMPNHSQEPAASSKSPNLKNTDVLCIFKIRMVKRLSMCVSKTSDHIKIKISNPSQKLTAPSSSKSGLKGMNVFCTFRIKIKEPKLGT